MCESFKKELEYGLNLAKSLVSHVKNLGAGGCEIPIDDYIVIVKKKDKECPDCLLKKQALKKIPEKQAIEMLNDENFKGIEDRIHFEYTKKGTLEKWKEKGYIEKSTKELYKDIKECVLQYSRSVPIDRVRELIELCDKAIAEQNR